MYNNIRNNFTKNINVLFKLNRLSFSSNQIKIPLVKALGSIELNESDFPKETSTTKEELIDYFKKLNIMRRIEISSDELYKNKQIRGFCHLYIGQESIALGMDEGLTYEDPLITAYREHCQAYMRGFNAREIISEMMSRSTGATKGKGGSMHYYNKKNNFYGGNGIVGAQIPVGTGLAFALKYLKKKQSVFTMFGDGSVNQGQFLEAINMAGLWKLPIVYVIENNKYGMGTSVDRSNYHLPIYSKFRSFPGLKIDGMDVFTIREFTKYCKNYVINNGPMLLEIDTYRYQGHSMSDPGITYRTKDEVQEVRKTRDNIEKVKNIILDNKLLSEKEIKDIEKSIKNDINDIVEQCKKDPYPKEEELFSEVYVNQETMFIRGVDMESSYNKDLFESYLKGTHKQTQVDK